MTTPGRESAVIDSPHNPRVVGWKRLLTPRGREETACLLIEGPHLVEEAIRAGCHLDEVLLRTGVGAPASVPRGVPVTRISARVEKSLSEVPSPQGIFAVIKQPPPMDWQQAHALLVLDAIQDPGNTGTMIRTAHAFGIRAVLTGLDGCDPWNSKAMRASQGSSLHLAPQRLDIAAALAELREAGAAIIGADGGEDSIDYRKLQLLPRWALVIGNEGAGIRHGVLEHGDTRVRIPMPGGAESLSAPVAAGILMARFANV